MLEHEMIKEVDRLKDVFGDPKYSPQRVQQMYMRYKDSDIRFFKNIIDEMIVTRRFAPLAEELDVKLVPHMNEIRQKRRELLNNSFSPNQGNYHNSCIDRYTVTGVENATSPKDIFFTIDN